jgi:nitrite reductase (NADH) small subunit
MADARAYVVGTVQDLPPGSMRLVDVGRFGVGVYNVNGAFHALNNYCPHMGAPICRGGITGLASGDAPGRRQWVREGEIVRCPWHGWKFGITDGETVTRPVRRVKKYPVKVVDGQVILLMARGGEA